jgi:hypothetical protein
MVLPLIIGGVVCVGIIAAAMSKSDAKNSEEIKTSIMNNINNEIQNIHENISNFLSESLNETINEMNTEINTSTNTNQTTKINSISVSIDGQDNIVVLGDQKSTTIDEINLTIKSIINSDFCEKLKNTMDKKVEQNDKLNNDLKTSLEQISKQMTEATNKGIVPIGTANSSNEIKQFHELHNQIDTKIKNISKTVNNITNITKDILQNSIKNNISMLNGINQNFELNGGTISIGGKNNEFKAGIADNYNKAIKEIFNTSDITKKYMKEFGIDVMEEIKIENNSNNNNNSDTLSNNEQTSTASNISDPTALIILVLVGIVVAAIVAFAYYKLTPMAGGGKKCSNFDCKTCIIIILCFICIQNMLNTYEDKNIICIDKYKIKYF